MGGFLSLRSQASLHQEGEEPYPAPYFPAASIPNLTPLELVGSGSFSHVYTISPNRVIKVLLPSRCNPSTYAALEASIYRALPPSPHILTFHGLPAPGVLELEHCPIGSVQTFIRKLYDDTYDPKLRSLHLHSIATQTVRALAHLHANHVLHNDLGIRQLLLDASLTVKLVDFGSSSFLGHKGNGVPQATHRMPIVRSRSPDSSSGSSSSSSSSRSMEMAMQIEYSPRADVFALGSTLYEIFARGWAPYWALGDDEVMALFEAGVWPGLEELDLCAGDGVGERWKEVILRCWEGRFEGAEEVEEVVRR